MILKTITFLAIYITGACYTVLSQDASLTDTINNGRKFNTSYKGDFNNRIAFPVGGIGAGMFCVEGTGAISHMSVRNHPDMFNEPAMFAAIHIKGKNTTVTRVLEGAVPSWKVFGQHGSGLGAEGTTWGLPRFSRSEFLTRFPFGEVKLVDEKVPVAVSIRAWSPFIPTDADNSSLPVGALEYTFHNTSSENETFVFSYNSKNFMRIKGDGNSIKPIEGGFVLSQEAGKGEKYVQGDFAIYTDDPSVTVDHSWFRGGWWDPVTMAWKKIKEGNTQAVAPVMNASPGASLYVPFNLNPGESKTIKILMAWYVPYSKLRTGSEPASKSDITTPLSDTLPFTYYRPFYSGRFSNINELATFWKTAYSELLQKTGLFTEAFYKSTLPPEVTEAVAANLSILKSPTVMRELRGRMWNWEGCNDTYGSCPGSCTHVWNYAQAVPHLFPSLERSLRDTEFGESQDTRGHQTFRSALPIRPTSHKYHSAADGQLGGIMKVYRDWRISGDDAWLKKMMPKIKLSMDYCIRTWDPKHKGIVEEPHHNTYDIEFWGPDGMITSFYLGALEAYIEMSDYIHENNDLYKDLLAKGKEFMRTELYNGEYFIQKIQWEGLEARDPVELSKEAVYGGGGYSDEALDLLRKEGPKYQYGKGCLSDGILGSWLAKVCGLEEQLETAKVKSHLSAVYRYNLRKDFSTHENPQRPGFAINKEGGLLLCTWPKGGKPSLPFVYCDEVWTGIEYQVASHLIFNGMVKEGLDIVKTCRLRYDGRIRNPFNEYECGNWYARAMSSYGLIQALTGVRYDAVDSILYVDSKIGDFVSFLSTASGFGNVIYKNGKASVDVKYGKINIKEIKIKK